MEIQVLTLLVLVPLIGFAICMLVPQKSERMIFAVAMATILLELVLFLAVAMQWVHGGIAPLSSHLGSLYASAHYTFGLIFYFDWLSAVFFGLTAFMTTLVFIFSKFYMHREPGFKRFYCTTLLFFSGLSLIVFAGNFETLLIGWEFIGISSVLLISFYRDRFLPAKNALKIFSVYRIADACLLAAIWYAHHLFEQNVNFSDFSTLVAHHGNQLTVLGLLLLVAAMVKSAQFPFSYWLPRAMEGPTTSSAIFYGALSVHMGLFLLLRTNPLWEGSVWFCVLVAVVGLVTAFVASSIARVQSTTKTQIAYASITQIGIMFVTVAVGLPWLALIHFVCNASLRAYQLLISPSIVGYLVHDQFFNFVSPTQKINKTLLGKLRATLYILGVKEWSMDTMASRMLWGPLKFIGRKVAFLDRPRAQIISMAIFLTFAALVVKGGLANNMLLIASVIAGVISALMYTRAYTTKNTAETCWNLVMLGHLFGALFLGLASTRDGEYLAIYGVGVAAAFALGHLCLRYLKTKEGVLTLQDYHGAIYTSNRIGQLFFVVCLLFMAFPISTSFLAQDILLSSIPVNHSFQVFFFCLLYLMAGVSIMRLYIKIFFGPHESGVHEVAYKSS